MTESLSYWTQLQPYRDERRRCKNYTYGKQWDDLIRIPRGGVMSEAEYIRSQGSSPLKNNLIRRIVRNVVGVFRNNYEIPAFSDLRPDDDPRGPLAAAYAANVKRNCLAEIFARVMEEYLIGGLAVVRKRLSLDDGGAAVTDMVRPDSFFFNTDATDPRGWDLHTVGEIHTAGDSRIFEIWRKGASGWSYRFVDASGATLRKGESPLPGGCHPYVVKAYPFLDGEIHSFVADCIDQQRYINRLITLNDWIIRGSAKGALLIPESAIPDDLTVNDISEQWSRYNGVIRFKAKAGMPLPQQVATNATNVGISELLDVQLRMMEDVSGINAALQGQLSSGSVSGTLYQQQTRHALSGLTDILEGFRQFMVESARRDIDILALLAEAS